MVSRCRLNVLAKYDIPLAYSIIKVWSAHRPCNVNEIENTDWCVISKLWSAQVCFCIALALCVPFHSIKQLVWKPSKAGIKTICDYFAAFTGFCNGCVQGLEILLKNMKIGLSLLNESGVIYPDNILHTEYWEGKYIVYQFSLRIASQT